MKKIGALLLVLGILCLALGITGYETMKGAPMVKVTEETEEGPVEKEVRMTCDQMTEKMAAEDQAWSEELTVVTGLVDEFIQKAETFEAYDAANALMARTKSDNVERVKKLITNVMYNRRASDVQDVEADIAFLKKLVGVEEDDALQQKISELRDESINAANARQELINTLWSGHVRRFPERMIMFAWKNMLMILIAGGVLVVAGVACRCIRRKH